MEPLSFASFSLAAVLAALPADGVPVSQSLITTHISPAIAGQWQIDLSSPQPQDLNEKKQSASSQMQKSNEPKVALGMIDGVLDQREQRSINANKQSTSTTPKSQQNANTDQCRELYNFSADNEMWAVSGKERTYSRYLVTHRDEGLPIIAIRTIYDNNEMDCSGNQVDQTDETLVAFLKYDDNKMQWCADAEGTECFMDFYKVLP